MQIERDPQSGYLTTGHEWNGIKELNTPVPGIVWFFIAVTHIWALGYLLLMPAFPLGNTYTKGLLGADDRAAVVEEMKHAKVRRAAWTEQVMNKSYSEIAADPRLMADVRVTGRALFGDNCAVCHGQNARGGSGFPDLTRSSLWGSSPEAIAETIRLGINSAHKDSRIAQMPAFGRDQVLTRAEMENVVAYVLGLSGATTPKPAGNAEAGKAVYTSHCAVCHGPDGKGKIEVGAPDLTDRYWMHGGDEASIYSVVWGGLQRQMPSWEGRLSPVDRKILVLYLVELRKAHQ